MIWVQRLPVLLLLTGVFSVAMFLPAGFALAIEHFHDARTFFYAGLMGLFVTVLTALALGGRRHNTSAMRQLTGLLAAYILLPLFLAVPFHEAVRTTTFLSAYTEMLSDLTTTGLPLFDPDRLSGPEQIWRGLVGWIGGLMVWVSAAAILAPLTLGGFEVTASGEPGQSLSEGVVGSAQSDPGVRLWRSIAALTPTYVGLSGALCVSLLVAGDAPLVALMNAMATMATSGISPLPLATGSASGIAGEMIVFVFLMFSLSRLTFSGDTMQAGRTRLWHDPEFRLGLVIVAAVSLALFLRHWWATFDVGDEENLLAGLRGLWGSLFTALGFLSTAGFISADWSTAQDWSGLPTPGLILLGLALIGGGVATTAGGVKLLRVYALYLNGARELERLVYPHSVGRVGQVSRRIRRQGGFVAWVFFMMVAVTVAAMSVLLGALGVGFEQAMVLTITALSNTGPLVVIATAEPIQVLTLDAPVKLALCAGMVLGRLELLALIVMLSPDAWRE